MKLDSRDLVPDTHECETLGVEASPAALGMGMGLGDSTEPPSIGLDKNKI